MSILPMRIRLLALVWCCVTWFQAAVSMPVEGLSRVKKTVLILYGDPLFIPANRMIEQGLMATLSNAQPVFAEGQEG